MNTIKFEKGNVQIVAHRGLSGLEKENSNSAFVAAGNRSYFGIETDVRKTADGQFVLNHDAHFKRVAGENLVIAESSLALVQSVVLKDVDDTKNRADLRPGTLQNYISICKKYEKVCVLELKDQVSREDLLEMIGIINSFDYLSQVIFISFEYENLTLLREILPNQSAQFLDFTLDEALIEKAAADRLDLDIRFTDLTPELIEKAHAAGLKVNCWTVNTKEDGERLAAWGVDYITTNILE